MTHQGVTCVICGGPATVLYAQLPDMFHQMPGRWDVMRCLQCDLHWVHPMPHPDVLAELYVNYHTHFQRASVFQRLMVATAVQYRLFSWRLIRAMFKGWLGKSRIGHYLTATLGTPTSLETIRLLDVGAGNGWFVRLMTDLGWEAWGVEPDPTAAHDAETRAKVPVISASFDAALFPPSTWDVITFRHVFEHLPDPVSTIKAADTLLKPGGRLVILCPNTASIGARQFQDEWRGWEVPRHVFMYNPSNLARLVTTAGSFTIEVLETEWMNAAWFYLASIHQFSVRDFGRALAFTWREKRTLVRDLWGGEELMLVARKV